jgi:hypothetical protein
MPSGHPVKAHPIKLAVFRSTVSVSKSCNHPGSRTWSAIRADPHLFSSSIHSYITQKFRNQSRIYAKNFETTPAAFVPILCEKFPNHTRTNSMCEKFPNLSGIRKNIETCPVISLQKLFGFLLTFGT